jgi:hypothetical protein
MKINITRFSAVLVIMVQWLVVVMVWRISSGMEKIFLDFNATLPLAAEATLKLTHPLVLAPAAVATSLAVAIAEAMLKSAAMRFAVQVTDLFVWAVFACFCIVVLQTPLLDIIERLTH